MTSATIQLLFLFAVLVCYWVWKRYRRLTLLKRYGIPGPKPAFLTGNGLELRKANVLKINEWIKEYGKIFGMWDLGPAVVVADPELVRLIQIRDFQLFSMKRTILEKGGFDANPEYEVSIISTDISSQRWKEQRSLISTAFTSSKIKASVPLINDAIDVLLENIKDREKQSDFEVYDLFQRFTMDTIGSSAFGIHLNVQKNPENRMFLATKQFFEDFTKDWRQLPLYLLFMLPELFPIIYPIRRIQRYVSVFFGFPSHWSFQTEICRQIVAQRKANVRDLNNPYSRDDLLQRMIEASLTSEQMKSFGESNLVATDSIDEKEHLMDDGTAQRPKGKVHQMSDQEIAANASIFFDAGYETTSTLLAFLTHVLVNRQDIQDRIREDVNNLLLRDSTLGYNTMNSLPYLDSVIYETLRLFPPITGAVTRQSTVEYVYKGYRIPPDTAVHIPVHYLQRDPEVWEDAETFDPMRFYGENKWRASSPSFQAFGSGPRNCVGLRFALMEAKLVVARIVHKYRLVPGPRTESYEDLEILYKPINEVPKNGIFVKVIPI